MKKKINSEINYQNTNFKVKIGTIDKKNPETVYVQLGTYITPKKEKDNYSENIDIFKKTTKNFIKQKLETKDLCDSNNFITIIDIADDRILYNKKSYLEIQLYLKNNLDMLNNKVFKNISKDIHNYYINDSINFVENELNNLGFLCTKKKK